MKPIIYEVNLTGPCSIEGEVREWLLGHIDEMEEISGFLPETEFLSEILNSDDSKNNFHFSVRYRLESESAFESYLKNQAERMRSLIPPNLKQKLEFSRRLLRSL